MRLFLPCLLVACGNNAVDDVVPITVDATIDHHTGADVVLPPYPEASADGPVYVGGPLACAKCTCDGTLYACLSGSCEFPPSDASADGSDADGSDGDASDAAVTTCGKNLSCWEIPVGCLPKPTCACITKATGMSCTVAADGSGFLLQCP